MSKFIFKERAYFWPADVSVPRKSYAPDEVAFGTISLHKNGQAKLKLDGLLGGRKKDPSNPNRITSVAGRFFRDGRCILMLEAWSKNYTYRSDNIDHEDYECLVTIVGDGHIEDLKKAANQSRCVSLPFGNFEDWLFKHPIEVRRTKRRITAIYKKSPPVIFGVGEHKARLIFDVYGPWIGKSRIRSIKIEQKTRLEITPLCVLDAAKAVKFHRHLQDFLILLTNQEISLEWPQINLKNRGIFANIYYWREEKYVDKFELSKTWINFHSIKSDFCGLFNNWLRHSESVKAGFYLYSSTRRGLFSYVENRFMSLVGGMEALHRLSKRERLQKKPNKRTYQVLRIIDGSDRANSKIRRWLRNKLQHASEVSLSERVYDLATDLPIKFEDRSLREFVSLVAEARNDLAHFGSIVRAYTVDDMHGKLNQISNALDIIYHARILIEVWVEEENVRFVFEKSPRGGLLFRAFTAANLTVLDVGVLKD